MNQKIAGEIGIAGHVQLKWAALHQMPVHDDPHSAVIPWRHDANQKDPDATCVR